MKTITIWIIAAASAVIVLGGWAYIARDRAVAPIETNNNEAATVSESSARTNGISQAKEFTVTGQNFSFLPKTLTVKKGDAVKIIFKNAGGTHDFVIDEFTARTERINGGQEETISFEADKTGSFEYYCSVGNHRAMGMRGTLTVTPQ